MTRLERPAATAAVEPVVAPLPEAKSSKSGVVIVGGGPAGLGAALLLAKRGWQDITVLEQRSAFNTADADKSYGESVAHRRHACMVCMHAMLTYCQSSMQHK